MKHPDRHGSDMPRGRKTSLRIELTPAERAVLESWQSSTSIRPSLVRRGRIILMLADCDSISHISRTVGIRRRFIYKWVARFSGQRIAGLVDKSGRDQSVATPVVEAEPEQESVADTTINGIR